MLQKPSEDQNGIAWHVPEPSGIIHICVKLDRENHVKERDTHNGSTSVFRENKPRAHAQKSARFLHDHSCMYGWEFDWAPHPTRRTHAYSEPTPATSVEAERQTADPTSGTDTQNRERTNNSPTAPPRKTATR